MFESWWNSFFPSCSPNMMQVENFKPCDTIDSSIEWSLLNSNCDHAMGINGEHFALCLDRVTFMSA